MTDSHVGHDSFARVTWLIHMWDMTHLYMWHESIIYMWDMSHSHMQHKSIDTEMSAWWNMTHLYTWFIYVWDMTHLYVRHESLTMCIRETWFIHNVTQITQHRNACLIQYDSFIHTTHLYMGHDSFIYGTWLIYTWDMSHSHTRHESLDTEISPWYNTTHLYARLIYIWDMNCLHVGHESLTHATYLGQQSLTHVTYVGHESLTHATYVGQESLTYVTRIVRHRNVCVDTTLNNIL